VGPGFLGIGGHRQPAAGGCRLLERRQRRGAWSGEGEATGSSALPAAGEAVGTIGNHGRSGVMGTLARVALASCGHW